MSLRERLIDLRNELEAKNRPIGSCCIYPAKHTSGCADKYARSVAEVGHPFDEDQIAAALKFIPEIWMPARSFRNDGTTSYSYKHELEAWWRRHPDRLEPEQRPYISNGNFIAAMILLGFEWRVATRQNANARFKLRNVRRERSRSPERRE